MSSIFSEEFHTRVGVRISESFLSYKHENQRENVLKNVLDQDLRSFIDSSLVSELESMQKLSESVLFQVISVKNIAQPSKNQQIPNIKPECLKLRLTDGGPACTAIALESVSNLSTQTAPGTKIIVQNAQVLHGMLMIKNSSVKFIGGEVSALVKQWKAERELKEKMQFRATDKSDPPPRFTEFVPPLKESEDAKKKSKGRYGSHNGKLEDRVTDTPREKAHIKDQAKSMAIRVKQKEAVKKNSLESSKRQQPQKKASGSKSKDFGKNTHNTSTISKHSDPAKRTHKKPIKQNAISVEMKATEKKEKAAKKPVERKKYELKKTRTGTKPQRTEPIKEFVAKPREKKQCESSVSDTT